MAGTSFRQGGHSLEQLAQLNVSAKQVERVVHRIGEERCAQRDAQVEAFLLLPLAEKSQSPEGVTPPNLAVVMADGGRLQILDRTAQNQDSVDPAKQAAGESPSQDKVATDSRIPAGSGPDLGNTASAETTEEDEEEEGPVSEPGSKSKHWREDKVAVLLQMSSPEGKEDPCPDIPKHFIDPKRVEKLAREMQAKARAAPPTAAETARPDEPAVGQEPGETGQPQPKQTAEPEPSWDPPTIQGRKVVASRQKWKSFGPIMAAAAWSLGFFAAPRRAFVGDGSASVWGVWRRHFSTFVPIVDFIHVLTYVYAAAMAGRQHKEGWPVYVRWMEWVWQGKVSAVIEELGKRQKEVGEPGKEDKATSPAKVVKEALTYLDNHKEQMKYNEYRLYGLPISSSHIESEIKRMNHRVKGSEKFWSEDGAEAILQLRADYLSDDNPMADFWQKRQSEESGQRRYRQRS